MAERVAYQYAIEEVYWRHRIWPKEDPRPKPSLDAVMSPTQIEKKVNDYLRNSQLVAEKRQRPITTEQLQTELERMASATKQPEMLREIFGALGNDSLVIAECLARPILAERLLAELTAHKNGETRLTSVAVKMENPAYTLPQIAVPVDCADDTWTSTSTTNAPALAFPAAVWTGSEMIVWGGLDNFAVLHVVGTGGKYNAATDSWTATSTGPSARYAHTAIWTGTEMVVWGGWDGNSAVNTGGRYNPATDLWTGTRTIDAPTLAFHTTVWTGTEMIAWGGGTTTGGRYDPSIDNWYATSNINAPTARYAHPAVWTGSEMIVWGGTNGNVYFNTGGRYSPATDSWTATSLTNAPAARREHIGVWTGTAMIVWGGYYSDGSSYHYLDSGGRYNPTINAWTATSNISALTWYHHTAVWTGSEMIVWGGGSGSRYNPEMQTWVGVTSTNAPAFHAYHAAVWTGSEMIVWGGINDSAAILNTGGIYCAQPQPPIPKSAASRKTHGAAGAFDVDLPLTGTPGIECRVGGGATNDHAIVLTFTGNVTVNGNPQAAVTSGSGTIGIEGKPNGGTVFVNGNTVSVPLTNVANAQTINVTLYAVNGTSNFVIPMSILVGDENGTGAVNAGDIVATKSRIGQPVNATNFRADMNASGAINATDVSIVKSYTGTGLP